MRCSRPGGGVSSAASPALRPDTAAIPAPGEQPRPHAGGASGNTIPRRRRRRQSAPAQAPAAATTVAQLHPTAGAPAAAVVWLPVYPAAQFLASYDAGRGQRYYIYGTTAPFAEIVDYYRTQLDDRGDLVFKEPPTHVFEVGRFREETMAFPPGVTVKDWTWGGSQGYPNPKPGAQPQRFPTIIMIVPPQPAPHPPADPTVRKIRQTGLPSRNGAVDGRSPGPAHAIRRRHGAGRRLVQRP